MVVEIEVAPEFRSVRAVDVADGRNDSHDRGRNVRREERRIVGAVVDDKHGGDGLAAGRLHDQRAGIERREPEEIADAVDLLLAVGRRPRHRDVAG